LCFIKNKEDFKMKRFLSILVMVSLLVMLIGSLAACGNKAENSGTDTAAVTTAPASTAAASTAPAADKKKLVGYLVPDTQEPFLAWLTNTVKESFAKDGVDVQIADAHGDASTQISQIENFTAMKADAIIIMSVDPTSVADAIKKAQAAGVKVMTAGSDPGVYDAIMNTDQFADGQLIAQMASDWINETFPGAAKESIEVAIFESRDTPEASKRCDGMADITKINPATKVVKVVGGIKNSDASMAAAENLFQTNPNVKVILCYNNGGAIGVSSYVTRQGSPVKDLSKFGTFASDVSDESLQAVKASIENKSAFRGVVKFGSDDLPGDTYRLVSKMINGETYEKVNFDPLTAITPKNIGNYVK
jgi:ABC-type sugar transport system substrate-binding protein